MKKAIVLIILAALVCALLCGCTPPEAESGRPEQEASLPNLQTGQSQDPSPADAEAQNSPAGTQQPGSDEKDPQGSAPNPAESEPTKPAAESVPETDDDSGLEVVSEYVVDGGDGFGFGGN